MNEVYYLLFMIVFCSWILTQRAIWAKQIQNILRNKKKENSAMKELARQYIGKECIVYLLSGFGSSITGVIREIGENGILMEHKDGTEVVNLDYITRIREYPLKANGKKKVVFD